MKPSENFLGLRDALQRADRFRRIDSPQRFDGFDAQVRPATGRQVAVCNRQQLAERLAIRGNSDLVDHQRCYERVHVIEQLEQNVATPGPSTGGNLPHHAILRGPRKIFHPARQKYHHRFRIEPTQQPGHLHGFNDWSASYRAPEILDTLFAQVGRQIRHMFGIIPQAAAIEARREMLHSRLRQHL